MAKAGDGAARSNRRRRSKMVNLRTTSAEKDRFQKAAAQAGYKTVSGWALDRLRSQDGMSLRDRRIVIGMLGKQIEPLRKLVRDGVSASSETLKALQQSIDADAVSIQKLILRGNEIAVEGNSEPEG